MELKEIKKLEKSQLMFYFLVARDSLIQCKKELLDSPNDETLQRNYEDQEKVYSALLDEIYRRMK